MTLPVIYLSVLQWCSPVWLYLKVYIKKIIKIIILQIESKYYIRYYYILCYIFYIMMLYCFRIMKLDPSASCLFDYLYLLCTRCWIRVCNCTLCPMTKNRSKSQLIVTNTTFHDTMSYQRRSKTIQGNYVYNRITYLLYYGILFLSCSFP